MLLGQLGRWYLFLTPIIYWPILYIACIIHELIHLLFAVIFMIPIQSISIGTARHNNLFNFGFYLTGGIDFNYPRANTYVDMSTATLYYLFIVAIAPSILFLLPLTFMVIQHPILIGIPYIYFVLGHRSDMESIGILLEDIAIKKRIENYRKLPIDN